MSAIEVMSGFSPTRVLFEDWEWLLHELRHVEQYLAHNQGVLLAIDGFSINYLRQNGEFEEDAREAGRLRLMALEERSGF